jgi:hypothetical protein
MAVQAIQVRLERLDIFPRLLKRIRIARHEVDFDVHRRATTTTAESASLTKHYLPRLLGGVAGALAGRIANSDRSDSYVRTIRSMIEKFR